ncbi:hypothetical protein BK126_26720 [Paenibacillus sp. FSL H7-0326]|uniref:type II toxin-antitoxin system PemK/MazF family toxin n=1 Tax=Paenibacillus sp. FSL H7-0326 TaxID=1921144 RepID=UPI00097AAA76|nr:type II toxin-antitoxin system PemK/MazF family toxin [Paenibacillus sp. FSL H7-0326]OMC63785.1 hypothetical protein BK126_26720 [Paenibacillus sp. FSL H7-0326]
MEFFKRGYVAKAHIPESIHTSTTPKPGFFLFGVHYVIVLHDHDAADIKKDMALVLPITSAKAEVEKAQKEGRSILPSYIPINKSDHEFLDRDSYVSTAQMMPINRKWLDQYVGQINPAHMSLIDIQVINNLGLMEMAIQMGQALYQDQLEQMSRQVAAAVESSNDE